MPYKCDGCLKEGGHSFGEEYLVLEKRIVGYPDHKEPVLTLCLCCFQRFVFNLPFPFRGAPVLATDFIKER